MSEKSKAILTVSLIIFFLSGAFLYSGIVQHNRSVNSLIKITEKDTHYILGAMQDLTFKTYRWKIKDLLDDNPKIIEAFATRNRTLLYELTLPKYEADCCANNFFDIMHFHLPDGTTLLRMHNPDFFDDNLNNARPIINTVNRNHKTLSGFEIGRHGAFYRIVQPIFYNNNYVGALEFGVSAYQIINILESETQIKSAAFFNESLWQKATHYKKASVVKSGDFMLTPHNKPLSDMLPKSFQFREDNHPVITVDKQTYIVHSHPIFKNFQGESIGGLVLFQDITQIVGQKNSFIFNLSLLTAGLLILAIIVLYYTFGRIIRVLRQREAKLSSIFRTAPTGIGLTADRVFMEVNNRFCEMVGYSEKELLGKNARMVYPTQKEFEEVGQEQLRQLNKLGTGTIETRLQHKDGTIIDVLLNMTPQDLNNLSAGITFTFMDMTEFKKMEAQFIQAQKMEAIGTLAGGVAHDFNNILTVIRGRAQLGMMNATEENPLWKGMEAIEKAGDRASKLTHQLLAFSRKQAIEPEMIGVNHQINSLTEMLARLIGEDVTLNFELGEKLSPILVDPSQLEQVIVNLVINAADAIKDRPLVSGRNITISTSEVLLDSEFVISHAGSKPGRHVIMEVSDNGCGIPKEVMEHVFEPFYTTKEVGEGTGLGLATVYGIVKQNKAAIYVDSEPEQGTTFKIYWPIIKDDAPEIIKTRKSEPLPGGIEVILLVEDEESTRDLVMEILQQAGYTVIEAENGLEALQKVKDYQGYIDLLFTDIVMPVMDGKELYEKLTAINPQIEVLFTSGYLSDRVDRDDKIFKGDRFIDKPYDVSKLLNRIRQLLDSRKV